jgi:methylmalonyl-CoA mutase N-terminal domain/subunit
VAQRQGVHDAIGGTVQNDILKEYVARGTYIYPPTSSLRLVTDIFNIANANAAVERDF